MTKEKTVTINYSDQAVQEKDFLQLLCEAIYGILKANKTAE